MATGTIAATLTDLSQHFEKLASAAGPKCPKRKKTGRSKEDIQQERKQVLDKCMKVTSDLLDAYNQVMKQEDAKSIGGLYARHSSRFQDSINDQIRVILEEAVRQKVFIPRENVFFDIAIRGCKERRPGLIALKNAIKANKIQTFMVFATSRLYRQTYKALQFVEEELVDRNIRGIFVKSNIDTEDGDNWKTLFQAMANMDEAQVRLYGAHIHASHEGLFDRGMVHTTLRLGYTGEIVEGEFTRLQRPRRKIVIDPDAAKWIVRVFYWYIVDGMSLTAIAKKLNAAPDAPAPAKSMTGLWTNQLVVAHLRNEEYRGWWKYGANKTKWLSKKDYAAQKPRETPLKERLFEDRRIIPDDCWYAAQELLDAEACKSGRKSKDDDQKARPNLLRKLFLCPEHRRRLVVGGAKGRVLACPLCRCVEVNDRPLFTHLNRELALKLTLNQLIELVSPTDELVDSVIGTCKRESSSLSRPDPEVLQTQRKELATLESSIEFNRRNPGVSEDEQLQTEKVLKDLRVEKNKVLSKLGSVESAMTAEECVPDVETVREFLEATSDLLRECFVSDDETLLRKGRRVIDGITTGTIKLYQVGERVKSKGHLQGRFQIDIVKFVVERLTGLRLPEASAEREVIIDYQKSKLIDEQSETAKRLWDEGLLGVQIAKQMGCNAPYVTKLLQYWFDKRGEPRPNNKSRRIQLENKQTKLPIYKQIANDVYELMDKGLSNLEIARQLKTNDCNVSKAITWWHKTRKLPVPTAADRRQQKLVRALKMLDEGVLLKDIAKELDYSPRGLKLALKKYTKDTGEVMPDGRSRRGNASSGNAANGKRPESDSNAA